MGEVVPMRANDSLRSVVSGLGDPMRDKMAMTTYGFQMLDEPADRQHLPVQLDGS